MYHLTEADFVYGKSDDDIDERRPTPADKLTVFVNCYDETGTYWLLSHDAGRIL